MSKEEYVLEAREVKFENVRNVVYTALSKYALHYNLKAMSVEYVGYHYSKEENKIRVGYTIEGYGLSKINGENKLFNKEENIEIHLNFNKGELPEVKDTVYSRLFEGLDIYSEKYGVLVISSSRERAYNYVKTMDLVFILLMNILKRGKQNSHQDVAKLHKILLSVRVYGFNTPSKAKGAFKYLLSDLRTQSNDVIVLTEKGTISKLEYFLNSSKGEGRKIELKFDINNVERNTIGAMDYTRLPNHSKKIKTKKREEYRLGVTYITNGVFNRAYNEVLAKKNKVETSYKTVGGIPLGVEINRINNEPVITFYNLNQGEGENKYPIITYRLNSVIKIINTQGRDTYEFKDLNLNKEGESLEYVVNMVTVKDIFEDIIDGKVKVEDGKFI